MTIRHVVLIGTFGVAATAFAQTPTLPAPRPLPSTFPPPELTKLKGELEALQKERDKTASGEDPADAKRRADRIQLRVQLIDLLKQLQERPVSPPKAAPPAAPPAAPVKPIPSEVVGGEGDPIQAALNLYKADDIDAAHRKFKGITLDNLSRDDVAFVQYMTACCLRRLGQYTEAMALYREVAVKKDNSFLAENAVWQISVIKSTMELESQLKDLRPRKNSLSK